MNRFKSAQGLIEYVIIIGLAALVGTLFLSPTAQNTSTGIVNSSVQRQNVTIPTSEGPTIATTPVPTVSPPTVAPTTQPTVPPTVEPTAPAPPCVCPALPACQYGTYTEGTITASDPQPCVPKACTKYLCKPLCQCKTAAQYAGSCPYGYNVGAPAADGSTNVITSNSEGQTCAPQSPCSTYSCKPLCGCKDAGSQNPGCATGQYNAAGSSSDATTNTITSDAYNSPNCTVQSCPKYTCKPWCACKDGASQNPGCVSGAYNNVGSAADGTSNWTAATCVAQTCPRYSCQVTCTCDGAPACPGGTTLVTNGTTSKSGAGCTTNTGCTKYVCVKDVVLYSSIVELPFWTATIPIQAVTAEHVGYGAEDWKVGWLISTGQDYRPGMWSFIHFDFSTIFATFNNVAQTVRNSFLDFFGAGVFNAASVTQHNANDMLLLDRSGSTTVKKTWGQFAANLTINGTPISSYQLSPAFTNLYNDIYMRLTWVKTGCGCPDSYRVPDCQGHNHHGEIIPDYVKLYFLTQFTMFNGPVGSGNLSGTTALNNMINANIIYTDPNTGQAYRINSEFVSPIKISLDGKDAVLNSDHHFVFDIDGFNPQSRLPIITTGGLNKNEAWLISKRPSNNPFYKEGALNGETIFGDHLGKFKSGYEDLAALYKDSIKVDEHGKRYVPLKKLSLLDKIVINIKKLFGIYKSPDPSYELKMITKNNKIFFASDLLTRVYVDYKEVKELDKLQQNMIAQRGIVHYTDGRTAQSADQWFKAITLTPIEKKDKKNKK